MQLYQETLCRVGDRVYLMKAKFQMFDHEQIIEVSLQVILYNPKLQYLKF